MTHPNHDPAEYLRPTGAAHRYGLSARTLSRKAKEDPAFPRPIRWSRGAIFYSRQELDSYFLSKREQLLEQPAKEVAHA